MGSRVLGCTAGGTVWHWGWFCVSEGGVFKCMTSASPSDTAKDDQLLLCREIIAVSSQIHTKHMNTLCGQNVELLNVKLAVHIVTTGLLNVSYSYSRLCWYEE